MRKTYIRTALVVVIGIFLLVGGRDISTAQAEVAKTTKNTLVMEQRGEKSRVITRVPPGKTVKVIAREGRWVKVRYEGRTGWVTRTSLTATTAVRSAPPRRGFVEGRNKKRDFSGSGPGDRVGADTIESDGNDQGGDDEDMSEDGEDEDEARPTRTAVSNSTRGKGKGSSGDDEDGEDEIDESDIYEDSSNQVVLVKALSADLYRRPTSRSTTIRSEAQGTRLVVLKRSTNGQWFLVENASGDQGWIRSSLVGNPDFSYPKMIIRTGAHLGYTRLSQAFASDGQAELGNYEIGTGAASVAVGGDFVYRVTPTIMLDIDVAYTGSYSSPGIHYDGVYGATDLPFMIHEINAGAAGGYNFNSKNGMVAYLRAGYHYNTFRIQEAAINGPQLPSEILQGITLGAHLDIPRLSGDLGLRIGADALPVLASRAQTARFQDGQLDSAFAAWGAVRLTYQLSSQLNVEAAYRYAYAKTTWTGPGQRYTTGAVEESSRRDMTHLLSTGLGTTF
jgi:uncharacterized protein YgiM (DUF1202 family)